MLPVSQDSSGPFVNVHGEVQLLSVFYGRGDGGAGRSVSRRWQNLGPSPPVRLQKDAPSTTPAASWTPSSLGGTPNVGKQRCSGGPDDQPSQTNLL